MTQSLTLITAPIARVLFALALLVAPALITSPTSAVGGGLFAAVSDDVQGAVDTIDEKTDSGDSVLAPIQDETIKTAKWVIWLLWLVVPLILFGSLVAWGVVQAKQNGIQAAQNTFIAVGVGVIMYFGVMAIFFT